MVNESKLSEIADSDNQANSGSNNSDSYLIINGFQIKKEHDYEYKIEKETVLYSDGYYLRICLKEINKNGELKRTTFFHSRIPPTN